jgi:hypothetical protein
VTGFSRSPALVDGGLVQVDPTSGSIRRVIALQYNPDTLTRSFQLQAAESRGDRAFPLRLKAPAIETIKLDAELDAIDQLEHPDSFPTTARLGLHPQLALLESLVSPSVDQLVAADRLAGSGQLEIFPMESLLTVFVWSSSRIAPVRVTELSVTEEAFDVALNPIRAKVSLGMRVLSVNDVGYRHRAGTMYLAHQSRKETLATMVANGSFAQLGIAGLQ